MTDEQFDDEVDIANYDQYHAEAIDQLRQAETFILAVPQTVDENDHFMRVVVMGGGDHFDMFRQAVTSGMVHAAVRDQLGFEGLDEEDPRLSRARHTMWLATGVNVFLAALNVFLIVTR